MLSVTAVYIHNPLRHSTRVARSFDALKMWKIFLIAAVSIVPITSWTTEEPAEGTTWTTEEPTEGTTWTTEVPRKGLPGLRKNLQKIHHLLRVVQ